MNKTYLGDGLYIDEDGYQIRLFTSDGVNDLFSVYLEPAVLEAFLSWLERRKADEKERELARQRSK